MEFTKHWQADLASCKKLTTNWWMQLLTSVPSIMAGWNSKEHCSKIVQATIAATSFFRNILNKITATQHCDMITCSSGSHITGLTNCNTQSKRQAHAAYNVLPVAGSHTQFRVNTPSCISFSQMMQQQCAAPGGSGQAACMAKISAQFSSAMADTPRDPPSTRYVLLSLSIRFNLMWSPNSVTPDPSSQSSAQYTVSLTTRCALATPEAFSSQPLRARGCGCSQLVDSISQPSNSALANCNQEGG